MSVFANGSILCVLVLLLLFAVTCALVCFVFVCICYKPKGKQALAVRYTSTGAWNYDDFQDLRAGFANVKDVTEHCPNVTSVEDAGKDDTYSCLSTDSKDTFHSVIASHIARCRAFSLAETFHSTNSEDQF